MQFAIPGFIQNLCTPTALTTLLVFLVDYATPVTRAAGEATIRREVNRLPDGERKRQLLERLEKIRETDQRDLYV